MSIIATIIAWFDGCGNIIFYITLDTRTVLCYYTNCIKSVSTLERRNRVITLDYADRRPIYEQVVDKIKDLILLGVLETDSQLPSVRELAMDLSINPNTVQRAYAELERQSVIYCVKGRGNFVAGTGTLKDRHKEEMKDRLLELVKMAKKADITEDDFVTLVKEFYSAE